MLVKLAGDVRLDPATGQITTVFDNLPQVPFTTFAFSFQGGPRAVLSNPTTCGEKTVSAVLTPWSGTAPKTANATFTIDQGCTAAAFAPALRVTADSTAAGRPAGAVTMEITRPDGAPDITRVTTALPPGLAGSLKGVPVCPEAQANAGTCPAETRVGRVSALAGAGDAPVALAGTVSLTGPFGGGLAGLAIAIPGRVGPVDLGTVIVRASIVLRPDGGLSVTTTPDAGAGRRRPGLDPPARVHVRPARVHPERLELRRRRPWPPCSRRQTAARRRSRPRIRRRTAPACPFAPRLEATIGVRGKTAEGKFAPLHAVITVPAGQAATATAEVDLPRAVGIDLARLGKACPPGVATCPASARIGSAVATTPLLAAPLTSPVTLAVPTAGELPGLALQLTGPVSLPLFGKVDLFRGDNKIHNTFAGIPDVPLERFDLKFTTASPLKTTRDVCHGARQTVTGKLTGHNGKVANLRAPLKVAGCPPVVTLKRRSIRVKPGRDGAAIRTVKLGSKRVKQRVNVRAGKRYRVTVVDRAKQTWKLTVRARR